MSSKVNQLICTVGLKKTFVGINKEASSLDRINMTEFLLDHDQKILHREPEN